MYFFRDIKLADDLKYGRVTEKQQMLYLLLTTIFASLFMTASVGSFVWSDAAPLNLYDRIIDTLSVCICITAIILSYKINQGHAGNDFLKRYLCLSFPIFIKTILLIIVLSILAVSFDNPSLPPQNNITQEEARTDADDPREDRYLDAATRAKVNALIDKHTAGVISEEEYLTRAKAIISQYVEDTENPEYPTGIWLLLASLIGYIYMIWRYVRCFRYINKDDIEKDAA